MPAKKTAAAPKGKRGAPQGNRNGAAYDEPTVSLSLRLPATLAATLRAAAATKNTTLTEEILTRLQS